MNKELEIIGYAMPKNLKDTPFSINRLFVWAIGVYGLIGIITMALLAIQGKTIPPQIQSVTMFCAGALVARIEKGLK